MHPLDNIPFDFNDRREDLPRNPDRKWGRRSIEDIKGLVIHQVGPGGHKSTVEGVNKYHIGPNHISEDGAPRICYTWAVDREGGIHLCNDWEDITWSQSSGQNPVPQTRPNTSFMAILVLNSLRGPEFKGSRVSVPDPQQEAVARLVDWLMGRKALDLPQIMLFGHQHFGKLNCPGDALMTWINERREAGLNMPDNAREWQQMLVDLGYDLGTYGPNGDGVDGDWGGVSIRALKEFQKQAPIHVTAWRDSMTAQVLAWEHAQRFQTCSVS